mmetsp:Transcript_5569/g.14544  ORF Transcript_5569/g.14544 Transcript_5569/m.14544 type:complete len:263 (+) Transcript_5569:825-1613(+)
MCTLAEGVPDDRVDGALEAHIEHAVRLVQHQHRAARHVHARLRPAPSRVQHVPDAPGRADDQLAAAPQRRELRTLRRAAVDRNGAAVDARAKLERLGRNLQRQLTRGRHDEGQRRALGRGLFAVAAREHGQEEAECLAGARLGDREHVTARDGDWPTHGLHGARRRETLALQNCDERGWERGAGQGQARRRRVLVVAHDFVQREESGRGRGVCRRWLWPLGRRRSLVRTLRSGQRSSLCSVALRSPERLSRRLLHRLLCLLL